MNLFGLSASDLMIWGFVLHLIADWPLQNDWMAKHKMLRAHLPERETDIPSVWYLRHPAAYIHAGIHGALLAIVFGWVAFPLAIAHLIIDTRTPLQWWSKLVGQTQPANQSMVVGWNYLPDQEKPVPEIAPVYDVGTEVRFWTDQVFHIACIALAAVLVTL